MAPTERNQKIKEHVHLKIKKKRHKEDPGTNSNEARKYGYKKNRKEKGKNEEASHYRQLQQKPTNHHLTVARKAHPVLHHTQRPQQQGAAQSKSAQNRVACDS